MHHSFSVESNALIYNIHVLKEQECCYKEPMLHYFLSEPESFLTTHKNKHWNRSQGGEYPGRTFFVLVVDCLDQTRILLLG